jgi:hypothetical protein
VRNRLPDNYEWPTLGWTWSDDGLRGKYEVASERRFKVSLNERIGDLFKRQWREECIPNLR